MKKTHLLSAAALLLVPVAAGASHPEPRAMPRIRSLAHEVERAARHVHRAAERRAHHGDYWEEKALRRLHELEGDARHFHRQVEKYYQDPYHTESDFRRLRRSYYRAQEAMHWLHAHEHVNRDFYRLEQAMEALLRYYGADDGYYERRHRQRYPRWQRHLPRVEIHWEWWR